VTLVLAGCAHLPVDAPSGDLTRLRVALFPGGSTLPAYAAGQIGSFERHGLHVELTEGHDLPASMAALANDQFEIAMSGPTLALIGLEKGLGVQIISSMQVSTADRPNAVWISRDHSITTLAQLRGAAVAVPSLTGIVIDSLVYLLERAGVDRDDVRFVPTPFPAMGDQLAAGNVDAAVATIPFGDAIAARGFRMHTDVIVDAVRDASSGSVDMAMTSVWTATQHFVDEHPEAIRAWRDALNEAVAFLDSNEPEARRMMQEWLGFPAGIIERAQLPDWRIAITAPEMVPYLVISKAVGATHTDLDMNTLVWQG
jgi:ABC-type nitrate/sulfonate/bicarbonate transport system substrate-binding protein